MKAKKITTALVVLLTINRLAILNAADAGPGAVAETRQALRDKGFKTDLKDFDFSTTGEVFKREMILDVTMGIVKGQKPAVQRPPSDSPMNRRLPGINLLRPLGGNSALVVWQCPRLQDENTGQSSDVWPELRSSFSTNQSELDTKCAAIMSGPIRFYLDASAGMGMLLPHLAGLKNLAQRVGLRAMVECHDGHFDPAWTNLLAETRLLTAWDTEPVEISQLARFGIAHVIYETTWQVLQTNVWTDEQLARLQAEWASLNYFTNLPETAAFARASAVQVCQLQRNQPSGLSMNQLIHEPKYTADAYMKERHYRNTGSYEDEKALLLHYRDREVELRNAIKCQTWLQMRKLPGVTNVTQFRSTNSSQMQSLLNIRATSMFFLHEGVGFLGRAARAEAERRVIITAVALERFHLRYHSYPKSLAELSPDILATPLTDFIDGQPLRYRTSDDGHFLLYSLDVDGIDDGGVFARPNARGWPESLRPASSDDNGVRITADLAWPRPASLADVATYEKEKETAAAREAAEAEEQSATAQWQFTESRQAHAEQLLKQNQPVVSDALQYHGHPLVNSLRNRNGPDTNKLSLAEMLTFEASIPFDSLANLGQLELFVDPVNESDSDVGCYALQSECKRAENGNCLITWNTIFECPGIHAIQLGLELNEHDESTPEICGPLLKITVTNLCQFSTACATYDVETGALFHAKLFEQNGTYSIDMRDTNGLHLKTMSGSTTNGMINDRWNLVDERGVKFTNGVFNCNFDLTLPESGRKQRLRL